MMKLIAAFVCALMIPASAMAAAGDPQATAAAQSWLALVDANDYAQSWNTSSKLMQSHVTEAQWETAGKAARDPLGPMVARSVTRVEFASTLAGLPDGQYAIVHFSTQFAHKASAVENVTVMMDGGTWKAAGYYIK